MAQVRYPEGRVATLDDALQNPEEEKGKVGDGWMEYDATRPLEGNCEIKLLKFEDPKGKETFWHSSAHVLGETLELEFGVHLTHGPPTSEGFFYDSYAGKDVSSHFFVFISYSEKIEVLKIDLLYSILRIKTTIRSISAPKRLLVRSKRLNALS